MTFVRGYWPKVALSEIISVDDSKAQQTVSHYALAGEQHSQVYRPQPHGFTSNPPQGSTGIVVSLGGERSRSVLLGGEHDKYRPTGLKEGNSEVYDTENNTMRFSGKDGVNLTITKGDLVIDAKEKKIKVTAKGDIEVTSSKGKIILKADGDAFVVASGKVYLGSSDGKNTYAVQTTNGPSSKVFAAL
jgi:phage baseplate assembly protein V